MKTPTAILTADIHLDDNVPVSRTDDFYEVMFNKVQFIEALQEKYDCPVLDAGDLCNKWKPSLSLLADAVRHLPLKFYTVPGNHDLPSHNINNLYKSGLGLLDTVGTVNILDANLPLKFEHSGVSIHVYGCAYGQEPTRRRLENGNVLNVLVFHTDVYTGKIPWPGCLFPTAKKVMKKYGKFDLIVTGHNHKPFVVDHGGTLLVNPGSMMRRNADQMSHKPRVYLWFAEDNSVEPVYLPIEKGVVTREHIETTGDHNERIDAFVARLKQDYEVKLSFKKNMEQVFATNKLKAEVKEYILKGMES